MATANTEGRWLVDRGTSRTQRLRWEQQYYRYWRQQPAKNSHQDRYFIILSGDFSADGKAFEQGYKLWADTVNKNGGVLGRQVQLDILSDASSTTQVVTNYQKLITVDHCDVVLGPFSSLLTKPASVVANRYNYAMIECAGGGLFV